eukprot:UC4_evm5s1386
MPVSKQRQLERRQSVKGNHHDDDGRRRPAHPGPHANAHSRSQSESRSRRHKSKVLSATSNPNVRPSSAATKRRRQPGGPRSQADRSCGLIQLDTDDMNDANYRRKDASSQDLHEEEGSVASVASASSASSSSSTADASARLQSCDLTTDYAKNEAAPTISRISDILDVLSSPTERQIKKHLHDISHDRTFDEFEDTVNHSSRHTNEEDYEEEDGEEDHEYDSLQEQNDSLERDLRAHEKGANRALIAQLQRDNFALKEKLSNARNTCRQLKNKVKKHTKESEKIAGFVEDDRRQQAVHYHTCLTTLGCLIGELRDIYVVSGIVAPNDKDSLQFILKYLCFISSSYKIATLLLDCVCKIIGEDCGGVVQQIFSDADGMIRALSFAIDGTSTKADTEIPETFMENKRLRSQLYGAQQQLKRERAKLAEIKDISKNLEERHKHAERLQQKLEAVLQEKEKLRKSYEAATMVYQENERQLLHSQRLVAQLESSQKHRNDEWQDVVNKTVRESEAIRAHAKVMSQSLEASQEEVRVCRMYLKIREKEKEALENQVTTSRKKIALLESAQSDIGSEFSRLLTTAGSSVDISSTVNYSTESSDADSLRNGKDLANLDSEIKKLQESLKLLAEQS